MRLAMVSQWLRARHGDPERRATATRYAVGVTVVQLGWVARLFLPEGLLLVAFAVLAVCEMLVPVVAERAAGTTFHVGHVVERYGLFTLIVLGESILAASNAIRAGLDTGADVPSLVSLSFAGLVIVFALWWLYFDHPAEDLLTSLRKSLTWGYGHYLVFASAAAVGAGLEVSVDYDTHVAHLPSLSAALTTTVPVAVFLLVVWFLQVYETSRGTAKWAFPAGAALVLAASFGPAPIHVTAVLLAALVAVVVTSERSHRRGA
jgi:low temperature requirement protein LtrA